LVRIPPRRTPTAAPERLVAIGSLGEGRRHDRQGRRRDDRRPDALHRTRGDEHPGAARETARERGRREQDEPSDEDDSSAQEVRDPPAEQQEPSERDRVGGERPLHRRFGDVEVFLDRRDRDCHDRNVEDGHEEGRPDDGKNQPAVPGLSFAHLRIPPCFWTSASSF
jgi:hypothetical protein